MTAPIASSDAASPFAAPQTNVAPAIRKPATDRAKGYLRDLMLEKAQVRGYDMAEATASIDAYLGKPRESSVISADIDRLKAQGYTGYKVRTMNTPLAVELEDGFYELSDGRIAKVQHAVHGSGRQYAKRLNTETGKFVYETGLVGEVRANGTRLSLERAAELGRLYGICIRCGATLTDEDSIARGIGPVCAGKGF